MGIISTSNPPSEFIEQEYPLRVEEYSLIMNSSGAGKYWGWGGVTPSCKLANHKRVFNAAGERLQYNPWGLFDGELGNSGRSMIKDGKDERRLDDKPSGVEVTSEFRIVVESPGAGSYGLVEEWALDAVRPDQQSGKSTAVFIERHYCDVQRKV